MNQFPAGDYKPEPAGVNKFDSFGIVSERKAGGPAGTTVHWVNPRRSARAQSMSVQWPRLACGGGFCYFFGRVREEDPCTQFMVSLGVRYMLHTALHVNKLCCGRALKGVGFA